MRYHLSPTVGFNKTALLDWHQSVYLGSLRLPQCITAIRPSVGQSHCRANRIDDGGWGTMVGSVTWSAKTIVARSGPIAAHNRTDSKYYPIIHSAGIICIFIFAHVGQRNAAAGESPLFRWLRLFEVQNQWLPSFAGSVLRALINITPSKIA